MITAIAFCPQTPLLVEPVDASQAAELTDVRAAARRAVGNLLDFDPDVVFVLTSTHGRPAPVPQGTDAGGSFNSFGVSVAVGGENHVLELGHSVGAWLLDDAGWTGPRRYIWPDGLDEVGQTDRHVAILVMADGTTMRTDKAPGSFNAAAKPSDDYIVAAISSGEPQVLADTDISSALELGATGIDALAHLGKWLALNQSAPVTAQLHYSGAPLGVGYWVGDWTLTAR